MRAICPSHPETNARAGHLFQFAALLNRDGRGRGEEKGDANKTSLMAWQERARNGESSERAMEQHLLSIHPIDGITASAHAEYRRVPHGGFHI